MQMFSETFVSDLVSVVFDGLIVHDGATISEANEQAAAIFGFASPEAMTGLPYHILLAPAGRRSTQMRVSSGTEGRYHALCRRQDGFDFTADVNAKETWFEGRRARIVAFRHSTEHANRFGETLIHRSLALDQTVKALATTIEQRDVFTAGHQNRVSALATRVAEQLGMSSREVATIRIAGNIHDIGKISVPAEILMKPSALTQQEFDLIKVHPGAGAAIVNGVDFEGPVRETVVQHHERLDASGYPEGIDDPIPEARILAVADIYDALTSSRPYRAGMTPPDALSLIREQETGRVDADALDTLARVVLEGDPLPAYD